MKLPSALYVAYCVKTCHSALQNKPVPVINTGIPCSHILTRKTCFNPRENLLSLRGFCSHCREPVFKTGGSLHAPYSTAVQDCSVTGLVWLEIGCMVHIVLSK